MDVSDLQALSKMELTQVNHNTMLFFTSLPPPPSQGKTVMQYRKGLKRLLQKEMKKRKKLSELGLDYDFPGYKSKVETSCSTHTLTNSHMVFKDE